jgi:beta-N-acetylhexosaminidase
MDRKEALRLAAALVMIDVPGPVLGEPTRAFIASYRPRAVCLFRKNLDGEAGTRALCAQLRDLLGSHALIAIDQEGGAVSRATFVPVAPAAMALGAVGDAALAHDVGAAVARGVASLGINWNFAPVLDVNNNPANPVIAERSFSEDPDEVVRLARAWIAGAHSQGVACCAKHFPGHGDTHEDSHHALPRVDKTLQELEQLELRPFRALNDEMPALMTAHIVYPQLDAEHPATLSRYFLTQLLRWRMGFRGVIITDALMMKAVREHWGYARAAVLALQAGADMVLAQGATDEQRISIEAIADALQDGRLDAAACARSAQRIDALAERFPLGQRPYAAEQRAADERLMRQASARALTALRGAVPPTGPLRVITQQVVEGDGVSERGLPAEGVASLWDADADIDWLRVPDLMALRSEQIPRDGRTNVLVSNQRTRYPLQARQWPIDLQLAIWNPFHALDLPAPTLLSWGYDQPMCDALRAWLAGHAGAPGHVPVQALEH